jgi:hypothetical protein
MSDWQKISEQLYSKTPSDLPLDWEDELIKIFSERLGKPQEDAEILASSRSSTYRSAALREMGAMRLRGIEPYVQFEPGGSRITWKNIQPQGGDHRRARMHKYRLRRRPMILSELFSFTDQQYEDLVMYLADIAGIEKAVVTRRSNDYGIDAIIIAGNFSNIPVFLDRQIGHKLIIQMKKYKNKVARDRVQVMCNTLDLIRNRSVDVMDLVPSWFWSANGTIAGWIIAGSGFQMGASDHARNNGIVVSNMLDLAHIICMSRGFDPFDYTPLVERVRKAAS